VLDGKVYGNRMVDLRISNNKLYYRAIKIIQHIMNVPADRARRCLLRSIYETDRVNSALTTAPISAHVQVATGRARIMPRALIMAGSRATHAQAEEILKREPVVRAAIDRLKEQRRR
jgi:hypothetical protein